MNTNANNNPLFNDLLSCESGCKAGHKPRGWSQFLTDKILLKRHPCLFRGKPILFLISLALIPAYGIGLLMLAGWLIININAVLLVTPEKTIYRYGVFSKTTGEMLNADVRYIQVHQNLIDRFFRVGQLDISSAGLCDTEISIRHMPDPCYIKTIIEQQRERIVCPPDD